MGRDNGGVAQSDQARLETSLFNRLDQFLVGGVSCGPKGWHGSKLGHSPNGNWGERRRDHLDAPIFGICYGAGILAVSLDSLCTQVDLHP